MTPFPGLVAMILITSNRLNSLIVLSYHNGNPISSESCFSFTLYVENIKSGNNSIIVYIETGNHGIGFLT
jgi:hypothetical protein